MEFQYRIKAGNLMATVREGERRANLTIDSYVREMLERGVSPEQITITVESAAEGR